MERYRTDDTLVDEWHVKSAGAERSSAVFETREEALEWARREAAVLGAEVVAQEPGECQKFRVWAVLAGPSRPDRTWSL